MIAIGIVLFIKGLGMAISIWPPGLYDWAASALGLLRAR
jgi:hypothetical protein